MTTRREELTKILDNNVWNTVESAGLKEALLAWADRWAGRPSRQQLIDVFKQVSYEGNTAIDRILSLYPVAPTSERKRVTREQVEKCIRLSVSAKIMDYLREDESSSHGKKWKDVLANSICTLIGVEEEKPPFWCKHLFLSSNGQEYVFEDHSDNSNCRVVSTKVWKACPICSAPRPVEKGRE